VSDATRTVDVGTVILFANLVIGALLAVAAIVPVVAVLGRLAAGAAALPLLNAALLSTYVFGEDDYRDTGISRWDAYRSPSGGGLGELFVACIALMVAVAIVLTYAAVGGRDRLFRGTAILGALVSAILGTATYIGFTAN
jgi:hypothetical protein